MPFPHIAFVCATPLGFARHGSSTLTHQHNQNLPPSSASRRLTWGLPTVRRHHSPTQSPTKTRTRTATETTTVSATAQQDDGHILAATLERPSSISSPSSSPAPLLSKLAARAVADTALLQTTLQHAAKVSLVTALLTLSCLSLSPSLVPPSPALAEVPAAAPVVGVFDDAGVIPKGTVSIFARAAQSIETNTGYHVHFVMVRSLPFGDSPTDYATQLFGDWGLGDKDVLFVASTKLARAGVCVGDAAAQVLSDDVAKSIAEETFGIPAGDERYGPALLDVSNRLIPVLSGKEDPGPPVVKNTEVVQTFKSKEETKNDRGKYIKVVGGVLVIAIIAPLIQTYWYVRDD